MWLKRSELAVSRVLDTARNVGKMLKRWTLLTSKAPVSHEGVCLLDSRCLLEPKARHEV